MTLPTLERQVQWIDEQYAKPFAVEDARRCLACGELLTREESFHHSQVPCFPLASNAK
jgi:hypothetical protein